MKTIIKTLIVICIIFLMLNCFSQISHGRFSNEILAQNTVERESREEFFSIENEEFNNLLVKILPDVSMRRFRTIDILPNGISNNLYLNEQIYNLEDINYLLFIQKYTSDTTSSYSDEELIKLYMYLEILFEQRCYDTCRINFPVNFEFSKIEKIYNGKIAEDLSKPSFANFKLNYNVIAKWKKETNDEREEIREYEFNIENSEFISIVELRVITQYHSRFFKAEENQAFSIFRTFPYSDEKEKYSPTGKEYRRKRFEELRKDF